MAEHVQRTETSMRTILTPGPVEAEPRVLSAMCTPILGQFDPEFTAIMNRFTAVLDICSPKFPSVTERTSLPWKRLGDKYLIQLQ